MLCDKAYQLSVWLNLGIGRILFVGSAWLLEGNVL